MGGHSRATPRTGHHERLSADDDLSAGRFVGIWPYGPAAVRRLGTVAVTTYLNRSTRDHSPPRAHLAPTPDRGMPYERCSGATIGRVRLSDKHSSDRPLGRAI